MHSDPGFLPDELCRRISALPWVKRCAVRLHEEGFHLSGIVLLDNASLGAEQAEEIRQLARSMNWRVDAVDVTLR
ncbi:hypothetical protein Psesu_2192 [Pseudoxanthomonas suwonensis 11-1]|uniref:BON domain-containing protein n=1 Tax=Pseudoxanthomonas suwonensis (strain 11-1) TaxID=743721 RepID=E6WV28_PSEUU|nr:hypothetical protein [Pseudoxanthomonas suwonensis]ADV28027.1 hypothetical protein Psesu_2192 [Pseudoxanthomonas suwonensis 11-1]